MNLEYQYLLDGSFHEDSRIWVYQSNRLLTIQEALEVEELLKDFTTQWKSHGAPVKGTGYLFFGQFIILMADERATGVSGCSTDSSVRLMQDLEKKFHIHLFDRTSLAFVIKDKVQVLPMAQIPYGIENGFISGETLYFNNLVQTKSELETQWIIPAGESWLGKRFVFEKV
jgi:hypothetical protein